CPNRPVNAPSGARFQKALSTCERRIACEKLVPDELSASRPATFTETAPDVTVTFAAIAAVNNRRLAVTGTELRRRPLSLNSSGLRGGYGDLRNLRQRLRQVLPGEDERDHPYVRQLRMRDPRAGADLHPLRHPHRRPRAGERRRHVLLRALRQHAWREGIARPRLT